MGYATKAKKNILWIQILFQNGLQKEFVKSDIWRVMHIMLNILQLFEKL